MNTWKDSAYSHPTEDWNKDHKNVYR